MNVQYCSICKKYYFGDKCYTCEQVSDKNEQLLDEIPDYIKNIFGGLNEDNRI